MRVSRKWIEWAHRPPAESSVAGSIKLCELADAPGRGRVDVTDLDLIYELLDVAQCYGKNTVLEEMGPWWNGEHRRIMYEARKALRAAKRELPK